MAINRYFTPAQLPTGQDYFKLPFNELYTALGAKQKQQDEANAQMSQYAEVASKLQGLQPDQQRVYDINDEINKLSESLSNTDLTSPEGKINLLKAKNKIRNYFGANGEATAIMSNLEARRSYEKKVDEFIQHNKDVDPNYKNKAMAYFDEEFAKKGGTGSLNPNTKSYNRYNTEDLSYVNIDDVLDKAVQGNIADVISNSVESPDGQGYLVKYGNETKQVTYNDIVKQATEKALADPNISSHISQGTRFGYYNNNDFDVNNALTQVKDKNGNLSTVPNNRLGFTLDRLGRKYGFLEKKHVKDMSSDATALHNMTAKKEDGNQYYDDIDGATWIMNPFGDDVTNAGNWVSKVFGNTTPKYSAWSKKVTEASKNYEKLKSQVETNIKNNVVDVGLNEAFKQAETDYNTLNLINKKLDESYEATRTNLSGGFKMKFNDPEVQAKYDLFFNSKQQQVNYHNKAKYFEENFDKLAKTLTTKQRSVKITDNNLLDREIQTGVSSQKGKQVFANNGVQLNADFSIPTGYVTQNSRGVMNQSYSYFSDEKEAKKAGVKVTELTGEEANSDINKSIKENKNLTVSVAQYPKDSKVYRVPTYTEPTTYTKNKYSNLTYTPDEQKIANDLNYAVNEGKGGIIQIAPEVTLHVDSKSDYSPYVITVVENGKSHEKRFKDEISAIKVANKLK